MRLPGLSAAALPVAGHAQYLSHSVFTPRPPHHHLTRPTPHLRNGSHHDGCSRYRRAARSGRPPGRPAYGRAPRRPAAPLHAHRRREWPPFPRFHLPPPSAAPQAATVAPRLFAHLSQHISSRSRASGTSLPLDVGVWGSPRGDLRLPLYPINTERPLCDMLFISLDGWVKLEAAHTHAGEGAAFDRGTAGNVFLA